MIYGVEKIEDIIGIELMVVAIQDESEVISSIQSVKENGVNVVIGGVMSQVIAEQYGMHAEFIKIAQEDVYHALKSAKRVALVRRQEQERAEQFHAILDYATEGVIAINAAGVIDLVNSAAVKLTGISDGVIGLPVEMFFPQLGLGKVLDTGHSELGGIETINGQRLAINRVPIFVSGRAVGAVATFQPVSVIQELEGRIRRKDYERGHVAKLTFSDILGESDTIKRTISVAKEFGEVNSTVLIVGETGTGKEIFAQSIHNASSRRNGPFLAVNCAALPENLLESELFGYARGAFTGAVPGGKMGLFELAHMGTIFLDEISEFSFKLQGRLLRVLQEREIMRLGDDKVIPVDVRVIAAANRNLYKLIQEGLFREDLYYRIDILRLDLPPLRERRQDIIPLMSDFVKKYCQILGKNFRDISPEGRRILQEHHWPGNVRELRNIAERLAVLNKSGVIESGDLEEMMSRQLARENNGEGSCAVTFATDSPVNSDLNRSLLLRALEESNYHYGKAAAKLGISRTTLWRRLKSYSILK
jgi:propionate catabolism operon transcriptional regulator